MAAENRAAIRGTTSKSDDSCEMRYHPSPCHRSKLSARTVIASRPASRWVPARPLSCAATCRAPARSAGRWAASPTGTTRTVCGATRASRRRSPGIGRTASRRRAATRGAPAAADPDSAERDLSPLLDGVRRPDGSVAASVARLKVLPARRPGVLSRQAVYATRSVTMPAEERAGSARRHRVASRRPASLLPAPGSSSPLALRRRPSSGAAAQDSGCPSSPRSRGTRGSR